MTDEKEVLKRLLIMADYFKETLSDNSQDIYLTALNKYSDEQIFYAIEKLMFNKFFPRMHAFQEILENNNDELAVETWNHVIDELIKRGVNNVRFDEQTTRAINACGGIEAIGHLDKDQLTFKMKDFISNFKVCSKRENLKIVGNKKLKELVKGIG